MGSLSPLLVVHSNHSNYHMFLNLHLATPHDRPTANWSTLQKRGNNKKKSKQMATEQRRCHQLVSLFLVELSKKEKREREKKKRLNRTVSETNPTKKRKSVQALI